MLSKPNIPSKLVTEDRSFALPLYHGTSDFFASMILESGLGRRNIVAEWKLLDFIDELFEIKEALQISGKLTDEADLAFFFVETARKQDVTAGGFNYRYGGIYVSAAYSDAVRYCENSKGSEIITMIYNVLSALPEESRKFCYDKLSNYKELESAIIATHNPRILVLRNIPMTYLRSETGRDAMDAVKMAEDVLDSLGAVDDVALQLLRFECVSAIDRKFFEIEEVSLDYREL